MRRLSTTDGTHYDDHDWEYARWQLDCLGAGALTERQFGTLSTREKQRVLIARSLMTCPEVLFLDEATTGLDLGAREQLVAALADLAHDPVGPAIVMVTHHVEEIPQGFDHIALISDGVVTAFGSIDTVLNETAISDALARICPWSDTMVVTLPGPTVEWIDLPEPTRVVVGRHRSFVSTRLAAISSIND